MKQPARVPALGANRRDATGSDSPPSPARTAAIPPTVPTPAGPGTSQRSARALRLVLIAVAALMVAAIAILVSPLLDGDGDTDEADGPEPASVSTTTPTATSAPASSTTSSVTSEATPASSDAAATLGEDHGSPTTIVVGGSVLEPLSPTQEGEIGERVRATLLSDGSITVADDPQTTQLLEELLVQVAGDGTTFDVTLIESNQVNAFVVPGGSIFFTTSLVEVLEQDRDQLGFVMAHEVAHVDCRHTASQIERAVRVQAELNARLPNPEAAEVLYDTFGSTALELVTLLLFSRDNEFEADRVALDLMERSGLDPAGAIPALEALVELQPESDSPPSVLDRLLASHPPTQDRIDAVRDELG